MYDIPLDYFVSPISKKELAQTDGSTLEDRNGNKFKKDEKFGFWNFLPKKSPIYTDREWNSFQKLIDNFVVSYEQDPAKNVSYDNSPESLKFGEFCKYNGEVLDIGCGPHKTPSYIKYKKNSEAEFYGIDVLQGEQPKELNFVQAMGEHLPFKDELFDVTISGTSLLHYISVKAGIQEALRVTKKSGYLCIWLGVKSKDAPKPKESPEWYKRLETPAGAENPFHYKRYSEEYFEAVFKECKAKLINKEVHQVDEWRKNVFFRIERG